MEAFRVRFSTSVRSAHTKDIATYRLDRTDPFLAATMLAFLLLTYCGALQNKSTFQGHLSSLEAFRCAILCLFVARIDRTLLGTPRPHTAIPYMTRNLPVSRYTRDFLGLLDAHTFT